MCVTTCLYRTYQYQKYILINHCLLCGKREQVFDIDPVKQIVKYLVRDKTDFNESPNLSCNKLLEIKLSLLN